MQLPFALITLRFFSAAWWTALLCVLTAHFDPTRRGLRVWPQPGTGVHARAARRGAALRGLRNGRAEAFGHRTSVETIAQRSAAAPSSQRCELIVPRELREARPSASAATAISASASSSAGSACARTSACAYSCSAPPTRSAR